MSVSPSPTQNSPCPLILLKCVSLAVASSPPVCHYDKPRSWLFLAASTVVSFHRGGQSHVFKGRSYSLVSMTSRCYGNKTQIPQVPHVAATTGPQSPSVTTRTLLPPNLRISLGRKLRGGPPGSTEPPALSRSVDPPHPWCCLGRRP